MGKFILDNYWLILIITIILILALVGYIVQNFIRKTPDDIFKTPELETDLTQINVTENKSINEMLKQPSPLDNLNQQD